MSVLTAFLVATISSGTLLLFATLGEIMTEKVGNLNLGVEGMMMSSSFAFIIFSMWNPMRAILGAYVFGALKIIGFQFQQLGVGIPPQFVDMLPYLVTVLVLIFISIRKSQKTPPTGSLGVEYFREKR